MKMLVCPLIMFVYAGLYALFAFREPPAAVDHFFRIPSFMVFFDGPHRVRNGRLVIAGILALGSLITLWRFVAAGWI